MSQLLQDLRYALRTLLKSPGFAAIAVMSLALGIGANTTIFSVINAMFLRPVPVEDPASLMVIYTTDAKNPGAHPISKPNAFDIREGNQSFSDVLVFTGAGATLKIGQGEAQQVFAMLTTGNYFEVLGVRPVLGRTFLPEEDRTPATHPVAVLSYACWQRDFGADPGIVGKPFSLNGQTYTVVGVAPETFRGTDLLAQPNLWVPMMMYPQLLSGTFKDWMEERRALIASAIGRLKPGVTVAMADADIKNVFSRLAQEYPQPNGGRGSTLVPLNQAKMPPQLRPIAIQITAILMFVVGLVLLIACANVANLLLARAAKRRREIAIRLSLGASRRRLIRQLLTESLVLAVAGGVLGLLFAFWARDFILAQFVPPGSELTLHLDERVLGFTVLATVLTGLLFGLVPALQSTRSNVVAALKDQVSPGGRKRIALKSVIVAAQIALSLIALVATALFLRSLQSLQQVDPGFEREKLAVSFVNIASQGYEPARAEEFYRQARERVAALPGVEAAAWSQNGPLGWGFMRTVFLEGQDTSDRNNGVLTLVNAVGAGYFETLGLPLQKGRAFTEADRSDSITVAVINQTMAEQYWGGDDPIGRRFQFFGEPKIVEVVGVVKNAKYQTLGEDARAAVYLSASQWFQPGMAIQVRTSGDPQPLLNSIRGELKALEPGLPLPEVRAIGTVLHDDLAGARQLTLLLGIFGGLALAMASLGIYGVTSYSVSQRTREIGIRMALGARAPDVLKMVVGQGLILVLVGLALGLGVAFGLTIWMAGELGNVLVGVNPSDPVAFAATSVVLGLIGGLAIYVPARRATRVNPIVALKYE